MNVSHKIHNVPAHRVVNRIGLLTGKHHFSGSNMMKELLESEGVKVKNNIVDGNTHHMLRETTKIHQQLPAIQKY